MKEKTRDQARERGGLPPQGLHSAIPTPQSSHLPRVLNARAWCAQVDGGARFGIWCALEQCGTVMPPSQREISFLFLFIHFLSFREFSLLSEQTALRCCSSRTVLTVRVRADEDDSCSWNVCCVTGPIKCFCIYFYVNLRKIWLVWSSRGSSFPR